MAERIVSPGVYTKEVDQSYLPGAIAQIGAAVIGTTVKGPALIPTTVSSFSDFQRIFGDINEDSYVPYVVREYLANGGPGITITRLLYEDGYNYKNGVLAIVATSASVETITHILHPTQQIQLDAAAQAANIFTDSVINSGSSGSFEIKISGSYTANDVANAAYSLYPTAGASISASIGSSVNNYVTTVFGTDPKSTKYPVYVQYENPDATSLFNNLGAVTVKLVKLPNYPLLSDFSNATTPWITSQKIGSAAINLFKFATLSHGTSVNHEVKIGIRDIVTSTEVQDPDGWPEFTVEVRRVNTKVDSPVVKNSPYSSNDTDKTTDQVELYRNVNLNPDSPKYIVRVIGDRYQTITDSGDILVNGGYANKSKFIRVIVDNAVTNKGNSKTLFPFGFRALTSPVPVSSGSVNLQATSYITSQVIGSTFENTNYHGFDFSNTNNLNYLAPTPSSASSTGSNVDFYLGDVSQSSQANYPLGAVYSGSLSAALNTATFANNIALNTRKFIVPFQDGFDGAAPNLSKNSGANIIGSNTFGFDCSSASSTGTVAYNKAFALLSNTDYYDINLLITPGIIDSIHGSVTLGARNLVETRQDAFYVMDSNEISDSISDVTSQVQNLDSNYTACYWPWLKIINPTGALISVPPSVIVPGALAFTDKNAFPWYAPAGLQRGVLTSVTNTYVQLNQSYRDSLYNARVNPIAFFPNNGVVIWGQKTLQARPSALDRVNVRRLLIAVKKYIASATRFLVFEPNSTQTRKRFENIVNPYLEQVKNNQGLYAFRVVMDETNNTSDLIDQNILYGQLFLQPTRTAEFVILDFNIQPTGAEFAQ